MNTERIRHENCPCKTGTWGPVSTKRKIEAPNHSTHYCNGCGAYAVVEEYIQRYDVIICSSTSGGKPCKDPAVGGFVLSGARGLVPRCETHHEFNLAT